ncbi:MAG TPA: carbohydrate-binding protein [Archangium sp.]|nr:carbohydrate-binding protein [Archangium sp.]
MAAWVSSQAYVAGNQVTYGGKLWRAKWWTQNEVPSTVEWGPWAFVSNCQSIPDGGFLPARRSWP